MQARTITVPFSVSAYGIKSFRAALISPLGKITDTAFTPNSGSLKQIKLTYYS